MDAAPEKYAPPSEAAVLELVRANPLAWVVGAGEDFSATPLPVRPEVDGEGGLVALVGHFARSNPQVARLRARPRAAILVMGLHAYISPSWMADRTQAPSWNYASAAFDCDLTFLEGPEAIAAHLEDLVQAHEAGRQDAWALAEMGERYGRLARGVVAFRAEVRSRKVAFKLGQDERDDVFADILAGLRAQGDTALADQMDACAGPRRS